MRARRPRQAETEGAQESIRAAVAAGIEPASPFDEPGGDDRFLDAHELHGRDYRANAKKPTSDGPAPFRVTR